MEKKKLTTQELEKGLPKILASTKEFGILHLIVRRPEVNQREELAVGELDVREGLMGDTWKVRSSSRTTDGSAHPDMQINIMNSHVIDLLTQDKSRWSEAGDQLYVDMDLSAANLPPGTKLRIGNAELMVTNQPHTGCGKFSERFGSDALKFVNSPVGRELNLRGINAKVVKSGTIKQGDRIEKVK